MALFFKPPPPPPAPTPYSPPSQRDSASFEERVLEPLHSALSSLTGLLQGPTDPSLHHYYSSSILTIFGDEDFKPLWPVLYPTSQFETNLLRQVHAIRADLKELPLNAPPPQLPAVDVASVVAAIGKELQVLKDETSSSLKSFADAVKAPAPVHPPPPHHPKLKNLPPSIKGNRLPQAVVRYQGRVLNRHRPSFADFVPKLNQSLHNHPKFSHIRVVGVKWTAASNLLVRAQAPSPSALVAALEVVQEALSDDDHLFIKDIIPNTRWSRMTLSHVYTGKGPDKPAHSPEVIHEELTTNNPSYAALIIRQLPSWIRDPEHFRDGQVSSSVSFAFEDPDGSRARQLIGSSITAFGNLRCTLKAWVPPKKPPQEE
jgi:hypothetical protein